MERKSIFKKILSVFTAGALSLSLMTGIPFGELSLGVTASAASDPEKLVFDVSQGNITIGADTISYGSNQTVEYTEGDEITITGTTHGNIITVKKDVSANIKLSGAHIYSYTVNRAAFEIADDSKGNVNITLEGENTLKSGECCAGLQKNGAFISEDKGKLTISGNGSLTALGGLDGAGIGGGHTGIGSNITIIGGSVTATGSSDGAGIGGGFKGAGNNITIGGGTVTATGGKKAAGIGGGFEGNGTNITISSGTVTAIGGEGCPDIGRGSGGITSGFRFDGGTIIMHDNANIPLNTTLTIGENAVLEIPDGITLANKGTIDIIGNGTIENNGNIVNVDGAMPENIGGTVIQAEEYNYNQSFDITKNNVVIDSGFIIYGDKVYKRTETDVIMITGETTTNTITVEKNVSASIRLSNVNIDVSGTPDKAAFKIADNNTGNVEMILDGKNTLKSGANCAGLQKNVDYSDTDYGELTISGEGSLKATGGAGGAGIGGGVNANTSKITIDGGTITATGGDGGAGIGDFKAYGSNMIISGGSVKVNKEVKNPTDKAGGSPVYPLELNTNGNPVSITTSNGDTYFAPSAHDGNTICVYLPAGNAAEGLTNKVTLNHGKENEVTYKYYYSDGERKWLADAAAPTDVAAPTNVTATYGDTLASVVLPSDAAGEWRWAEKDRSKLVGVNGVKTFSAVYDFAADGYDNITKDITITVTPKPINVTAENKSKTYGKTDPELTFTIDNSTPLVGGDTLTGVLTRESGEDVKAGGYTITQGTLTNANNPNYDITFIPGTFTIEQAAVKVTADSFTIKVGNPLPTYTYKVTGLVNGETLPITPVVNCPDGNSETADTYDIVVTGDAESANYKFSYVNGTLTVSDKPVVTAPVINPNGGTFSSSQTITITCGTEDAEIYYTTDGSTPTTSSMKYEGEFTVSKTTTVKAIAVKDGMDNSAVVSAEFTKNASPTPPINLNSPGSSTGFGVLNNPVVNGKEQSWTDILGELKEIPDGGKLTVDMNGNTTVPADVIKDIANKDEVVTFKLNSEISFVVDGAKISGKVSFADLSVGVSKTKLSTTNFSELGGTAAKQFTLGRFSITSKMSFSLDKANAGKFASLMKLNSKTGKYDFVSVAKIDANGKALVDVNGKGDYLLIIDSETKKPGDLNNDTINNSKDALELLKGIVYERSMNEFKSDHNGDGKTNAKDAMEILKVVVGLVPDKYNLFA